MSQYDFTCDCSEFNVDTKEGTLSCSFPQSDGECHSDLYSGEGIYVYPLNENNFCEDVCFSLTSHVVISTDEPDIIDFQACNTYTVPYVQEVCFGYILDERMREPYNEWPFHTAVSCSASFNGVACTSCEMLSDTAQSQLGCLEPKYVDCTNTALARKGCFSDVVRAPIREFCREGGATRVPAPISASGSGTSDVLGTTNASCSWQDRSICMVLCLFLLWVLR